ncbi:MAG: Aspartate aminotransferase [Chlamydiae bacterium]|nr:Aspartate aminotransferase [Chlamydiota bacterium]
MTYFKNTELIPEDPILCIPPLFAADQRPNKVNLGVGAYRDAEGHPLVLTSVQKAEVRLLEQNLNNEYLPMDGDPGFIEESLKLAMGEDSPHRSRVYASQTVGGSGALKIAGDFLKEQFPNSTLYLSHPSWSNHRHIFSRCGFELGHYPYSHNHTLDFEEMCDAIKMMKNGDLILFHACCHNPTGIDPTFDQWKIISTLVKEKGLFPIFDMAYQGFSGGLDQDAAVIRHFADEGHEMALTISHSKNFGLYGERIGLLAFFVDSADTVKKLASQIKSTVRGIYSSPPAHGARIVKTILQSPELTLEWKEELVNMRDRIIEMRKALVAELYSTKSSIDFSFIQNQRGLFSMTGLNREQVSLLRAEHGIYMPSNGRMNIAGVTSKNVKTVAEAFNEVL